MKLACCCFVFSSIGFHSGFLFLMLARTKEPIGCHSFLHSHLTVYWFFSADLLFYFTRLDSRTDKTLDIYPSVYRQHLRLG